MINYTVEDDLTVEKKHVDGVVRFGKQQWFVTKNEAIPMNMLGKLVFEDRQQAEQKALGARFDRFYFKNRRMNNEKP